MTVKTRAQLKSENASDFPDNVARLISPADLRGQMDDVVDSALFPEDGVVTAAPGDVNGMTALRGLSSVSGSVIHLNHHTTPGDLGGGNFRGVTGAAAGTYTDNDGTIIVPTGGDGSAAWLRVWDNLECHVGWFGAKCDHVADDYPAIAKALSLFTNGRASVGLLRGVINFGPGCDFSQPILLTATHGYAIRFKGSIGTLGFVSTGSYLRYTGPATRAAIIIQAGDNSGLEDLNIMPGLAWNAVHATADNQVNTTLTLPVTAGTDVVATPASMAGMALDASLMIDAGGPNFEIVYVTWTTATTFTADFKKDHAAGVMVGNGPLSTGLRFINCTFITPYGPVPTGTVTVGATPTGADVLFTTNQAHNLKPGMSVRVGKVNNNVSFGFGETIQVKTVPSPTTFTTFFVSQIKSSGVPVKYPGAGFLMGNTITNTCMVSEVAFDRCHFTTIGTSPFAGFRQVSGGNNKNITFKDLRYSYIDIAISSACTSGIYVVNGMIGTCNEAIFAVGGGAWTVTGLEDESVGARALLGGAATNPTWFNMIGCSLEGSLPPDSLGIIYTGSFNAMGCEFRGVGTTYMKIVANVNTPTYSSTVSLIGCNFANAQYNDVIVCGGASDLGVIVAPITSGKLTILNCNGGVSGGPYTPLRNLLPAFGLEGIATYDPGSLATGTVDAIQTVTVTGAALGDLVEASFSNDMQGIALRAWVSAADTVKYQFHNPTAGTVDLASGTVKCRVRK